jgi:EmrB/QacA subfamily drug resistance transporter
VSDAADRSTGRWVLAASVLGSGMAFIDGTVVSISLPVLQRQLSASVSTAQWIVEAYSLFLSSLVLVGGALADRFGRRLVFVLGTILFAAASLACGLAPGAAALVVARGIQGIGAALLVPSSLAMLGAAFPAKERGRAVGAWSALTSIGSAIGPALGGWLVQAISWRAVFLINLPIAAALLWITFAKVPETRNPHAAHLDLVGAALATLGLGALVYGLIEAPTHGWAHPGVWGPIAGSVVALAAFLAVELRLPHPMLPLGLFRNRTFSAANLLTLFLYAALAALFFFLPFVLIQSRGYSPAGAGVAMLPLVFLVSVGSRPAGMLVDRIGPRLPLTIGPFVAAAGFALFAILPSHASYAASILPAYLVLGIGMAITVAPLTATVLNAVDRDDQGTASGINNAVARLAALLAIAVFGIAAARPFNRELDRRLSEARVSESTRRALDTQRSRLGAMQPPANAGETERRAVERAVGSALEAAFREVSLFCAALGAAAAVSAAVGVRKQDLPRTA